MDKYCFVKLWCQSYIFVGILVLGHVIKGMYCGLHFKNWATGLDKDTYVTDTENTLTRLKIYLIDSGWNSTRVKWYFCPNGVRVLYLRDISMTCIRVSDHQYTSLWVCKEWNGRIASIYGISPSGGHQLWEPQAITVTMKLWWFICTSVTHMRNFALCCSRWNPIMKFHCPRVFCLVLVAMLLSPKT